MKAVFYHWWGYSSDADPLKNLREPIILSIATLRYHNPSIPIYVLDLSDSPTDWNGLDKLLNFRVEPISPHLREHYSDKVGWRNLSRMFDLHRLQNKVPENEIIYIDCDIFFLKDILPLDCSLDRFCFNRFNSGFFYYDKNSAAYRRFIELFEAYATTALNDENFRHVTNQFGSNNDYFVLDETLLYYMQVKHRELFNFMPPTEHFLAYEEAELSKVKTFHLNSVMVTNPVAKRTQEEKHSRGLVCLMIRELYKAASAVLGSRFEDVFTKEEKETFFKRQLPFAEAISKLRESKRDRLYYLTEAVK